jgi:intein/homing endonuclease
MLGDGHISHFQITVTLGNKEARYAEYVRVLVSKIFNASAKISIRSSGYRIVYLGSTLATSWLFKEGLVTNKVKSQIGVPFWIFSDILFMKRFLRGFFDTDGSVYKIKFGTQISLTNYSFPLLEGLQKILTILGYTSSEISTHKIYLTKDKMLRIFLRI